MTRYYQLSRSLDELADLAMDRFLRQHGFRKAGASRYYIGSGIDEEVHHHQDHRWTHDVGRAGSSVFDKHSPQHLRDHYRDRLHHAFTPWDRSHLPSAPDLRDYGRIMYAAARDGFPDIEQAKNTNGNPHLLTAMNVIKFNVGRLGGATVDTFATTYLAPLEGVLKYQSCVATLLGVAFKWEAEIWHNVDIDLKELVDDAFTAMNFDNEKGGLKDLLNVASAAANVATLLTGSPFAAGTSVALGILKDLAPDDHPDAHAKLSGHDPDDIIDSVEKKLVAINRWVKAHEDGIRRALVNGADKVDAHRGDFDLAKPRELLREDDRDQLLWTPDSGPLSADQKHELRLERRKLKTLVEHGLRSVAEEIDQSRRTADRTSSSSVWRRGDGRVGIGERGPYAAWDDLFDRHRHALTQTARELRQAGQHLLIATEHLFDTDTEVNADLRRHSRRIHA